MNEEVRTIKELREHPKNEDIYGDENVAADLVESIKELGVVEPIQITPSGVILSGHRRFKAAKKAGLPQVPVRINEVEDELAELEIIIHSNRQRVKSDWQIAKEAFALQHIERERAKQRMSQGGKGGIEDKENEPSLGQVRDIVGDKLGVSGRQVDKLTTIVAAVGWLEDLDRSDEADKVKTSVDDKSVSAAYNLDSVKEYRDHTNEKKRAEESADREAPYILLDDWKVMTDAEKGVVMATPGSPSKKMNSQVNLSVDWAGWTWNPITGCRHNCPYCYAHDLAHLRYDQGFNVSYYPERLSLPANTPVPTEALENGSHCRVFTCSMADMFGPWVPLEWIDAIMQVIREQSQWTYLTLTKFPQRLAEQDWPENVWAGATIDRQANVDVTMRAFDRVKSQTDAKVTWLSLEPLLEPVKFQSLAMFDMVVIGGAAKSWRTPAWQPPSSWYEDLLWQARKDGCHVYMKDNLGYRPQEYPGMKLRSEKRAPDVFFKARNKMNQSAAT